MIKRISIAGGMIVVATAICSLPVHAHDRVQWSVTVGGGGYSSPGVVMVPQSQYIYGAPPSVYSPPPPILPPPTVVYVQPPPVIYQVQPPARLNVYPSPHRYSRWHDGHHRRHGHHGGYGHRGGRWER